MQTSSSTSTSRKEFLDTCIQANFEEEIMEEVNDEKFDFSKPFLFSDSIIIAEERSIHCHRVIMSLHSPVFKLIFESDFKEANSKVVKVPESYDDFMEIIKSFYVVNPKEPNLEKAKRMLPIAHKYQIDEMVEKLERIIMYNMTENSAPEMINLGDTFNLENMVKSGVEIISKFPSEKIQQIFANNNIPQEIKTRIMERRVQNLEKAILEIQKSFSHSCLKIESKVSKVPSNHCSHHGVPLTSVFLASSQNTPNDHTGNDQQGAEGQNPTQPIHLQSNVSASIRPALTNSNHYEMNPVQNGSLPQNVTSDNGETKSEGVCKECAEHLKIHVTDICKRAMHKVPVVLFKN